MIGADTRTALALGMAAAIGLGIARFAYALVLPDMRADLGWSWGEAGWMNTTNAVGYLVGALLAGRVAARFGSRAMTLGGVAACIVSLFACAVLRDAILLNAARVLAGIGGAFAFVGGGVLATGLASRAGQGGSRLLALFYAAPGLGIALSGAVVPATLTVAGVGAWPAAWAALALVSLPLALWLLVGSRDADPARLRGREAVSAPMGWLLGGYFLFGLGYIAYMTFTVAFVREAGGGPVVQGLFWATIGAGAVVSAFLWSGVLERFQHGYAFATLCGLNAVGAAWPLVFEGRAALFVSAILFGSVFFSVVASTTAFVRRNLPPEGWAWGIGRLTVFFGAGQIVGPLAVGWLNDWTGGLRWGLAASAALLLLGALVALPQRDLARTSAAV